MDLLKTYTIKSLKLNSKRTIVTIIGIMLSIALLSTVSGVYSSVMSSMEKFEIEESGNFHVKFFDVPVDEITTIDSNRNVDEVFLEQSTGVAALKESKDEQKLFANVKAYNESAFDNLSVQLIEGRYPTKENEILIPTNLFTSARIKYEVGDEISLNVGTRMIEDKKIIDGDGYQEGEEIVNAKLKKYKIVGKIEKSKHSIESNFSPEFTFVTILNEDNLKGNVNVFARYNQEGINSYLETTADIIGVDKEMYVEYNSGYYLLDDDQLKTYEEKMSQAKYNVLFNQYLLLIQNNDLKNMPINGIAGVVTFIMVIIVVASVFCIKNSFDISISEKIKQYGILKSIGATKSQIKKTVYYEAFIVGFIGIVLGLILGQIVVYILIKLMNILVSEELSGGKLLVYSFSWLSIAISTILGIVTVYFSARNCARKASNVSAIDLIRNTNEITIKKDKLKTNKLVDKIFGIGGTISYKNLKRNNKKYRTTVISIIVSVAVFIGMSSFMEYMFKAIENNFVAQEYDITIRTYIDNKEESDLFNGVVKLDNIEEYSIIKNSSVFIKDAKFTAEFMKTDDYKFNDLENNSGISLISLDDLQYQKYLKDIGVDYDSVKNKAIMIKNIEISLVVDENSNESKVIRMDKYAYQENDKIKVKELFTNDVNDLEIGAVTKTRPFGIESDTRVDYLIVSDEVFDKSFKEDSDRLYFIKSNDAMSLQKEIDTYLDSYEYQIYNDVEYVQTMKNFQLMIGIFLYGLIIVISLIGVTNIFNVITTNIQLRKQEFAMLKSVGMTSYEFNKMIRLETLFMGVKSLVFAIPLGIGLSYIIYILFGFKDIYDYVIPYTTIAISIISVFILLSLIMKYSINKVNKHNIIETIRNENV